MSFDAQYQKGWETQPLRIEPCPHIKLGCKVQRNLVGAGLPRPGFIQIISELAVSHPIKDTPPSRRMNGLFLVKKLDYYIYV